MLLADHLVTFVEQSVRFSVWMFMKLRTLGTIDLATVAQLPSFAQQAPAKPLLIRDVTVIDCAGHSPLSGVSVLISDGHIEAIVPAAEMKAPPSATVLEGHGKYLIPGLWNMQVHLGAYADGKGAFSEYLGEGITGLRDMGSPLEDILRLRRETDSGTILGQLADLVLLDGNPLDDIHNTTRISAAIFGGAVISRPINTHQIILRPEN
jgi:hypothetical protein